LKGSRGAMQGCRVPLAALLFAIAFMPGSLGAQYLDDALQAGDLICQFRDGYRREQLAGLEAPRPADIMLIFDSIRTEAPDKAGAVAGSASTYSSRAPGRRDATVRATPKTVHFVERIGPSVRVTTLSACEQWKFRKGHERCVRFSAQHAWHFDSVAARDPELALARAPSGASNGSCEPWNVD
jgi:hypothetical protein